MPWNDNANSGQKPGPWGSPPPSGGSGGGGGPGGPGGGGSGGPGRGGPRRPGGGGGGGGPTPPDFDDLGRQLKAQLDKLFGGPGKSRGQTLAIVGGVAVFLYAASGVYIVQPSEQAVVKTFGAFTSSSGPGLRYRAPWPIQTHSIVPVTTLQRIDIGGARAAERPEESLMLTGDENIVDLAFTVQWRVSDAADYLFNVADPDATIKAVAESSMREVVGRTALQQILTTGRAQVQQQTQQLMQRTLDTYNVGVYIDEIQIRNAGPPPQVVDAFRDVATAGQDAVSATNVARGEAAKLRQEALGYRAQVVQEALGEAARFNQVYEQYRLAPAVTRQRLYLETMENVLRNSNKVIVDNKGATAPIILPPDALRPRAAAPAAPVQAVPSSASTGSGR